MTLTDALRAAIADPPDLQPLRALLAESAVHSPRPAVLCRIFIFAVKPWSSESDYLIESLPIIVDALHERGANLDDLRLVVTEPAKRTAETRSAEWTAAATRLAAWADKQVTQ